MNHRSALAEDRAGLDERLSELEETVARSGSRPIQLNIYGQVNRAILLWNDGFDSGTYSVDNHTSSTRFGFVGQAAHFYDPSIAGFPCTFDKDPKVCGGDPSQTSKLPAASWQGVVVGARIQF